jgi:hypothetical protein
MRMPFSSHRATGAVLEPTELEPEKGQIHHGRARPELGFDLGKVALDLEDGQTAAADVADNHPT